LAATRADAQSFDGKWAGEMDCAKLSFASGPAKIPFEFTVSNALVSFSKQVSSADGSDFIGIEEGTGIVSPDGKVTLKAVGRAASRKLSYTATYTGNLTDASGTLAGTQIWTTDKGSEDRACTITVQH
jgi:hypothetical protein